MSEILHRFSTAIASESPSFQNRTTHLKSKTIYGNVDDYAVCHGRHKAQTSRGLEWHCIANCYIPLLVIVYYYYF